MGVNTGHRTAAEELRGRNCDSTTSAASAQALKRNPITPTKGV
jgi:hypothetical protein